MITIEDVKIELRIEQDDTTEDVFIEKKIKQVQSYLKKYTRNSLLDFEHDEGLDLIVLYLVCLYVNPDTRIATRAGKTGENTGVQMNFINDLPKEFKDLLDYEYTRLNVHEEN